MMHLHILAQYREEANQNAVSPLSIANLQDYAGPAERSTLAVPACSNRIPNHFSKDDFQGERKSHDCVAFKIGQRPS